MTTDDHSDGVGAVDANTDSAAGEDPSLKVLTGGASGVETVRNSNGATAGDPEAVTSINANPWPAAKGDTVGGHSNDLHQVGADATAWRL